MGTSMVRYIAFLLFSTGLFAWACKPLDERADPNPAKGLRFSADTLLFDTVFTEQKTITLRLRVYNDNAGTITLESVALERAGASQFSLSVNGRTGTIQNIEIMGKDSAYVLISGRLSTTGVDTPLVIEDKVLFTLKGRPAVQHVQIIAKGQDAYYLNSPDGLIVLNRDTTFSAKKPIVLLSSILVDSLATLTILPGARLHFYKDAFLIVRGKLLVNGSCDNRVLFAGTRLEPYYKFVPGQWGYIGFLKPSKGNRISYATIENSLRGIQLDTPGTRTGNIDLLLENTQIRNVSDVGIWAFGALLTAYNLSVADCGSSYVAGQIGGRYNLAHCTFAQSGNTPFSRKNPLVLFTDFYQRDNLTPAVVSATPPVIEMYNNLLSGNLTEELVLAKPTGTNAAIDTAQIDNNLLSGRRTLALSQTNRWQLGTQRFQQPSSYDFKPDSAQPGITKSVGLPVRALGERQVFRAIQNKLYSDYRCNLRDSESPFTGAFEKNK